MALNDNAVLSVGTGKFYTATYNSVTPVVLPSDLLTPGGSWTEIGHTSLEDIFTVSSEGGDATTLGTLQNKTLRTKYAARTESFAFTLQQFDTAGLKLYYGSNATIGGAGQVQVPNDPTPTVATFLVVFQDGTNEFAFYVPKAEIYRNDDLSIADTESLVGLPIAVKPLTHGSNVWNYAVTPLPSA